MGGGFQVFLRFTDGALAVQRLRSFRPNVGIRNRNTSLCKQIRSAEFFYPTLPILTAHDLYGSGGFFVSCRFCGNFRQSAGERVEGFAGKRLSEGLERRAVGNAGLGIGTHGACHTVND